MQILGAADYTTVPFGVHLVHYIKLASRLDSARQWAVWVYIIFKFFKALKTYGLKLVVLSRVS